MAVTWRNANASKMEEIIKIQTKLIQISAHIKKEGNRPPMFA
jgi:hypothetical protein